MRCSIVISFGLCMATATMAQSCANGRGFCDSAGVCQDGTGADFGRLPECVSTRQSNNNGGGRGRNRVNGQTCSGLGGFCDSSGVCQDGTGADFGRTADCVAASQK